MPPVFEAKTDGVDDTVTSVTFTSPAVTDATIAIVTLCWERDGSVITSPSATFDGNACTLIDDQSVGSAPYWGVIMWYYPNPGSAKEIVISWTNTAHCVGACRNYKGVGTGNPIGTAVTATGNSLTPSVNVSSASGEMVVDIAVQNTASATAGAGQTERLETHNSAVLAMGSEEAGAASVTMSWTTLNSREWAILGVPLKPALAGNQVIMIC